MGTPLLAPTRSMLLAGCVSLWALRLGGYLFYRVLKVTLWQGGERVEVLTGAVAQVLTSCGPPLLLCP